MHDGSIEYGSITFNKIQHCQYVDTFYYKQKIHKSVVTVQMLEI